MGIFEEIVSFILFLMVFAAITFLAFVAAKYAGIRAGRAMRGKYMQIVDSISLGMDKRLLLVKAADQFFLIASSGKSLNFLAEVKIEEFVGETENDTAAPAFDFRAFFEKYLKNIKLPGNTAVSEKAVHDDAAAETRTGAVKSVFRNNLERLRTITRRTETDENGDRKDTSKNQ